MIHLLLHVNEPVMLITFVLFVRLCRLLELLFHFIEDLLQFVKILAFPSLQLRVVALREL